MKPDKAVLGQTARVAAGTFIMVGAMLLVYAVIGALTGRVALGGIYAGLLTVVNFFVMGLTVQRIAAHAAEKQRDGEELEAFSRQMQMRMRLSRNGRMIALFALIVVGIRAFGFDPLSTILPIAFPTVVIRALQIIDVKRESSSKGSEEP